MSGGIARGRLTEERKAWRKNHPHVRTLSLRLRFAPLFSEFVLMCILLLRFQSGFCGEAGGITRWIGQSDGVEL